MSFLSRIFGGRADRRGLQPLYDAAVAVARDKSWFSDGGVPDTIDGRFDMLAAIIALILIRLEREGESGRAPSVKLTELFIDDMDSTLRQIGIGDFVVGKHVGRMMSALGGRLQSFREAVAGGDWEAAVRRNLFRESPSDEAAPRRVATRLAAFKAALDETDAPALLAGELPRP